jgi:hypothetical protein
VIGSRIWFVSQSSSSSSTRQQFRMIRLDRWSGRYQLKPKKEVTRNAGCHRSERKPNVGNLSLWSSPLQLPESSPTLSRRRWLKNTLQTLVYTVPSFLAHLLEHSETCAQKSHISIQQQDSILTSVERMRRKSLPNFYLWWYKHRSTTGFRKCWWSLTILILFDDSSHAFNELRWCN